MFSDGDDGGFESTKTVREEPFDLFPAWSVAKNWIVLVPCKSPVIARDQFPALSALAAAEEKLFEMAEFVSAVPRNVTAVAVAV